MCSFILTFLHWGGHVIDESMYSIFAGPQSPCERTDLRMAIVADHLGLSWTGEDACSMSLSKVLSAKRSICALKQSGNL